MYLKYRYLFKHPDLKKIESARNFFILQKFENILGLSQQYQEKTLDKNEKDRNSFEEHKKKERKSMLCSSYH